MSQTITPGGKPEVGYYRWDSRVVKGCPNYKKSPCVSLYGFCACERMSILRARNAHKKNYGYPVPDEDWFVYTPR